VVGPDILAGRRERQIFGPSVVGEAVQLFEVEGVRQIASNGSGAADFECGVEPECAARSDAPDPDSIREEAGQQHGTGFEAAETHAAARTHSGLRREGIEQLPAFAVVELQRHALLAARSAGEHVARGRKQPEHAARIRPNVEGLLIPDVLLTNRRGAVAPTWGANGKRRLPRRARWTCVDGNVAFEPSDAHGR
jgi:hypothetical protein